MRRFFPIALAWLLLTAPAHDATPAVVDPNLATLRRLLSLPEDRIDLAQAKVAIDRIVDPSVDTAATLGELDEWANRIRARLPPGANSRTTLDTLLSTLYEPGAWNDGKPFHYDFDQPVGDRLSNVLLSSYLRRRKGQCVIMPITVVLLGQKLGLPITLAKAPNHVLAKYGDEESGQWLNVEATSGTFKYDSSYERELEIPEEALRHGTYLRPLTRRESVMLMAHILIRAYAERGEAEKMLALADLGLEVDPKDVLSATAKGGAYALLLDKRFKRKYPLAAQIPQSQYGELWLLSHQNLLWFATAEALGWREWSAQQRAEYAKFVQRKKPN